MGHRLVLVQQSDLGAQWKWISAELNLAEAGKGNEEMVCRGGGGEGETRRKLEEELRIWEQSTCESVRTKGDEGEGSDSGEGKDGVGALERRDESREEAFMTRWPT